MKIDWESLSKQVLTGTAYSSDDARRAIELILGEDFFEQAVNCFLDFEPEPGWELAEGVVKFLGPLGQKQCYEAYKNTSDPEKRQKAIYLIRHLANQRILKYIPEFLSDPDYDVQSNVAILLRTILEQEIAEQEDIIPILETLVDHPNEELRRVAIGEIHGDTIQDLPEFIVQLEFALWNELFHWKRPLKFDTIHGFDLRCIPWYGKIELSFLTEHEDFDLSEAYEEEYWESSWRLYNLPHYGSQIESLENWMLQQYEKSGGGLQVLDRFYQACASALKSDSVQKKLQEYNLAEDFQITVINPYTTKPWKNYY